MGNFKKMMVVFLVGVSIFSLFKYFSSLKEKYDLENNLDQAKKQVESLEIEKQKLLQTIEKQEDALQGIDKQNQVLKGDLEDVKESFDKQSADLLKIHNELEELISHAGILKAENTALREEKEDLNGQLIGLAQERNALKLRLGSVSELKKAIGELRKRPVISKIEIKKEENKPETDKILKGNRGFLLKAGKPTYPGRIKIEVNPLSLEQ